MAERRYSDDDVQRILARAAETEAASPELTAGSSGMTLSEIERVAAEAGMDVGAIRSAARSLETEPVQLAQRERFGLRYAAARTVQLQRVPDDIEWARVVSLCRDLFEASGREEHIGVTRLWRNGNLRVSVQPLPGGGATLEMRTRRQNALPAVALGFLGVLIVSVMSSESTASDLLGLAVVVIGGGLAVLTASRLQLGAWAKRRMAQFESLGREALRLTSGDDRSDRGDPSA